ncbi:MAG TPA: alpha-isopropylmalate synthase regulatory domain-containing protein, partial [Abditibacteriaceae bacterium]
AFSGSHQDAINKGFAQQSDDPTALWEVPYLPIDPMEIGHSYAAIIRINSQSGKGGVAYILETEFGINLPKEMRPEFGRVINALADERGHEITGDEIYKAFVREYLRRTSPLELLAFRAQSTAEFGQPVGKKQQVSCIARVKFDGVAREINGIGNGPIDAFVVALQSEGVAPFQVLSYAEHSLSQGAEAKAIAYIQIEQSGAKFFGAAIDTNIELASIKAVVSALNRASVKS